jgi:hypothetical protein
METLSPIVPAMDKSPSTDRSHNVPQASISAKKIIILYIFQAKN